MDAYVLRKSDMEDKMELTFDIEAFKAEAEEWAKTANQCVCCEAWANLDKDGLCYLCRPFPHKHPAIVITMA